jgi:VanZ family protein
MMNTSALPEAPMSDFDKLVHLLMFVTVAATVFFNNTRSLQFPVSLTRLILGSFLFPVLFGGSIELLQEYCTPSRSGDWMDLLYDTFGALLGWLVCWAINKKLAHTR